jgi:hypothetical protein
MAGGWRHFSGAEKRERIAHGRPPLDGREDFIRDNAVALVRDLERRVANLQAEMRKLTPVARRAGRYEAAATDLRKRLLAFLLGRERSLRLEGSVTDARADAQPFWRVGFLRGQDIAGQRFVVMLSYNKAGELALCEWVAES